MDKRKISVLAGILILVAGIVLSYFIANRSPESASREAPVQVIQVPIVEARPATLANTISFTGRVIPEERFSIYAEVTGRMLPSGKAFKAGIAYSEGDTILRLNDDEERQQLEAARYEFSALLSRVLPDINLDYPDAYPRWREYLEDFDATTNITPLPEVTDSQLRMFLNANNLYARYSSIRQQEIRVDKFTIRAPFDGVVTESQVDPGALVQPNQMLGEFTKLNPLEIEAAIPAEESRFIQVGDVIQFNFATQDRDPVQATVARKNARIEPTSQSVMIYVKVDDTDLRPGEYVEGTIRGRDFQNALRIHQDALVRDDDVFIIEDSVATFYPVRVLALGGDSVTIADVEPGTIIVDDFRDAAFEGTRVQPLEDTND